jgi:hypothetical protein
MNNPFQEIEERLSNIESLLLDIKHKSYMKESIERDRLNFNEALDFLIKQGYPISKSKLYKLTASNNVPHVVFNNHLVFSRKELLNWVSTQTKDRSNSSSTSTLKLAAAARRKGKGGCYAK